MRRTPAINVTCRMLRLALGIIVILGGFCGDAYPQTSPKAEAEVKFDVSDFTYTSKDRRDPFEPVYILRTKKGREPMLARTTKNEPLKQGYELEELRLAGIIKKGNTRFAMMEDSQGKGVLFKKGDPINPNMWVDDIFDTRIVLAYRIKNDTKRVELEIPKQ
jgi:Tfp pilus assembly protein PilP